MNVPVGFEGENQHFVQEISEIWKDILAVENIDAESDFFALGGDSVMVMAILLRIEEQYAVYLDPADLFETPVFEHFAARVFDAISNENERAGAIVI